MGSNEFYLAAGRGVVVSVTVPNGWSEGGMWMASGREDSCFVRLGRGQPAVTVT